MAGCMIASPKSGSGKTIFVCGLLEAARRRGLSPQAFKCGPDYIDGLFHRQVLGMSGGNLDSFFEGEEELREKYARASRHHLVVAEGAMGYFDGLGGNTARASAWEMAKILDMPVILLVDGAGASLSLLALIKGFLDFERELGASRIRAVVFNRMAPGMYPRMKELVDAIPGIRAAGYVPNLDFLSVGSRHLGLILPGEIPGLREQVGRLADCLEETLDWEVILGMAADQGGENRGFVKGKNPARILGETFRLGVAMDEAFCFYYQENLKLLKDLGAELVYFSPVHDGGLPPGLGGLLLGGGYPERYALQLGANRGMAEAVAGAAGQGMPVLAECGGYLYLLETLEGEDGKEYPMAGVFSGQGMRKGKNSHFGYISLSCHVPTPYLLPGEEIRGHEFHYWECRGEDGQVMEAVKPAGGRSWPAVRTVRQTMGGFPHLYYPSCPAFAERFKEACRLFLRRGTEEGKAGSV